MNVKMLGPLMNVNEQASEKEETRLVAACPFTFTRVCVIGFREMRVYLQMGVVLQWLAKDFSNSAGAHMCDRAAEVCPKGSRHHHVRAVAVGVGAGRETGGSVAVDGEARHPELLAAVGEDDDCGGSGGI